MPAILLDEYAARYQQALSRLMIAAEFGAVDTWLSANTLDDDEWLALYYALASGVAGAASDLAAGYTDAQLEALAAWRAPITPIPDLAWFDGDFEGWGASPVTHARWLVSEGLSGDEAVVATADKVSRQMTALVRTAENHAVDQVMDTTGEFLVWDDVIPDDTATFDTTSLEAFMRDAATQGYRTTKRDRRRMAWRRIPQGGACGWCRVVADRLYTDASARAGRAWHNYCRCTWRLVTPDESRGWKPSLAGDAWREIIDERADVPTTQGRVTNG